MLSFNLLNVTMNASKSKCNALIFASDTFLKSLC